VFNDITEKVYRERKVGLGRAYRKNEIVSELLRIKCTSGISKHRYVIVVLVCLIAVAKDQPDTSAVQGINNINYLLLLYFND
jgi:hypothetical protein